MTSAQPRGRGVETGFSSAFFGGDPSVGRSSQPSEKEMMPLLVEDAFLVLQQHRADLQRRLGDLESGVLRIAETRLWAAPVDMTNLSISEIRRKIAEIDGILSRV
jgi:hypothetical protein